MGFDEIEYPTDLLIRSDAIAMGQVAGDVWAPRTVQGVTFLENGSAAVHFPGEKLNYFGARILGADETLSGLPETVCVLKPNEDFKIY